MRERRERGGGGEGAVAQSGEGEARLGARLLSAQGAESEPRPSHCPAGVQRPTWRGARPLRTPALHRAAPLGVPAAGASRTCPASETPGYNPPGMCARTLLCDHTRACV